MRLGTRLSGIGQGERAAASRISLQHVQTPRSRRIIACDAFPSEAQLHEDRIGAISVDRVARLIHRHAAFGIRRDFNESN
jgi:hypothetical protein